MDMSAVSTADSSSLALAVDFSQLNSQLEEEKGLAERLREQSKLLDRSYRRLSSHLNRMHSLPASSLLHELLQPTQPMFAEVREQVAGLAQMIPPHRYYQWNQTFDWQIKNLCSCAALAFFLATGKLLDKQGAQDVLGISSSYSDRLLLSTEDYLLSLTLVTNELSRLAVTSVTLGDFLTPMALSRFVKDLHAGFQLLNLKNNELRRRFDSIKYDVKKIEEVVYDITLRGLIPAQPVQGAQRTPGLRDDYTDEEIRQVMHLLTTQK
ncbi:Translin [Tilletiaria anomala UBC 951]|uniref:Translin n=1 Tax=Tilletiaria anomala (strain ATCC 24038 / CBS 436.72 / UBC 951) TaxID=1037660 RepID=A0A066W8H1_TILAU|nr:Translin [Tilletiaria anomala UBC 951]KDN47339.1 Translin [Tilletiaria anomala UBC 951]